MKSKYCPTCGERKPAENYYVSTVNKSGLSARCIACERNRKNSEYADNEAYRLGRVEYQRRYRRKWYRSLKGEAA